jgi:nucleoside 2-deoxyribosyltransferase
MSRVYLAGPITGESFEGATDWREWTRQALAPYGIHTYSPLRGKDYLSGQTAISGTPGVNGQVAGAVRPLSTDKGICTRDRWDVQRADAVLMNLSGAGRVSIGTMIEIGWADAYRVPIIGVMEDENPHRHAMVEHLLGYIVPTLPEAVLLVRSLLIGG